MKSSLNNIISNFAMILFLSSCHTLEHQNIFIDTKNTNENQSKKIVNFKERNTKIKIDNIDSEKPSNKIQMAPIKLPKQKQKVKTVALSKKIKIRKTKEFKLEFIKDWSEKKLIHKMGQSDFIKKEGRLKSYQYYFSHCFLDIFLLKKENSYYVNHIQTRSTKLHGDIEQEKCLREISNKFN